MNRDVGTGPLARPFARTALSFACSRLLASLAPSAALTHLLAPSLARGTVNDWMSHNDLVLSHCAACLHSLHPLSTRFMGLKRHEFEKCFNKGEEIFGAVVMVQFMCKIVAFLQARVKRDVGDVDGSTLDSVFEFIFHCVAALSTFALLAKFNVSLVYARDDDAVILTPGSTPCPSGIKRFHSATRFYLPMSPRLLLRVSSRPRP